MRISRVVTGAALAAMLIGAAAPAPAAAQLGALKRKLKEKVAEKVIEKAVGSAPADTASATGGEAGAAAAPSRVSGGLTAQKGAPGAPARPGPTFNEHVLEMTPEVLDKFEKGLTAEQAVQQELDRAIGKVLPPLEYDRCHQAVIASPEGQQIYLQAGDLLQGDATQEQLQKMSQEIARRFDKLVEPKCGLDTQKAQQVRDQFRERLNAAAPQASGLTELQLSLLKERMVPLCAAVEALAVVAGEARIPTESSEIFWVYTQGEVAALQPRCARLAPALRAGA